jgi:AraC-like DNA-binding protein
MTKAKIKDRIKNWFKLSKQYLFTYKNGFFNLSFLSNSPEVIIESGIKMPFVKHNKKEQKLNLDSPFLNGFTYYANLEKGFWVFYSNLYFKNNVSFSPLYDNQLPTDFFCIAINLTENIFNSSYYFFDEIKIENNTVNFIQPKGDSIYCHFKGSQTKMFTIYINKKWVTDNIFTSPLSTTSTKELFTDLSKKFINYKYNKFLFENVLKEFENCFEQNSGPDIFTLKKISFLFLDLFISNVTVNVGIEKHKVDLYTNLKIKKVELFLLNNLYQKFPGIDFLSKKFKVSPTKLKNDFKKVHQTSLLKYYQEKQMQLALKEVHKGGFIKDIAKKFNYENVSKFSKTFQKYNNILPSETH